MTFSASDDLKLPPGTTCWVLTNGAAGYVVQCTGLTEWLGLEPVMKTVDPPAPWRHLAPWGPAQKNPEIAPPWPDILISGGRQTVPYARMIKKASGGKTFTAVLQHPHVPVRQFDFVWVPFHDRLKGPNVLRTLTSPHRITPEKLRQEAEIFAPQVAHLARPRICVLIGGNNRAYTIDEACIANICDMLENVIAGGASLMVTPSRRTGAREVALLRKRLEGPHAVVWDRESPNPYFGFMGQADALIVTCDSVNMVGEATATGKPVHVIELPTDKPRKADKFQRFLNSLYERGVARPFKGQLESWDYEPLNDTRDIAREIARRYNARQKT